MLTRCLALSLFLANVALAAPGEEATALIFRAGNTDNESERRKALEELASLASADDTLRKDAATLAEFVRQWNESSLKFYASAVKGQGRKALGDYPFGIADDSPLVPLTHLYRGRMLAWTLIESSTIRTDPKMSKWYKDEAVRSFEVVHDAFPENRVSGMYLGREIPWTKQLSKVAGAPRWASLQREQLERLREIIAWWIDKRQRDDGQFGGGWGDDCEMWRVWAPVLLGFDDPKVVRAQLKFSRASLKRGHLKSGFSETVTDVEHAAEDTTDNLVPLMVLEPNQDRYVTWSLGFGDLMQNVWTARNERGMRQFKSFYFSDRETSANPARAFDVIANVGALHPSLLAWQKTGDEKFGKIVCEWLDTWVDATARAENGKPAGVLPASIRWPDGQAAGAKENWWEPVAPGGYMHSYYIWPSVITEMTDAMVIAHQMTGNEKYLAPIRSMAAIRLKHLKSPQGVAAKIGSEGWCAEQLGPRENANSNIGALVKTLARYRAMTGSKEFDELLALESSEFTVRTDAAGRRELEAALAESAEALRVNFPGFTSEVRSTDRVMRFVQFLSEDYQFDAYKGVTVPKHELLYRMVTGDKNAPRLPQMAVRWLTPCKDLAVLVKSSSTKQLKAELFHFGGNPRPMGAQLRLLAPGDYHVHLTSHAQELSNETVRVERGALATTKFELPPGKLCLLEITPVAP